LAIVWRCLCDAAFSHFGTVPACDRQTHDDSIYRASTASRGKKNESHTLHSDNGVGRQETPGSVDDTRVPPFIVSRHSLDQQPVAFDPSTASHPRHLTRPLRVAVAARQQEARADRREPRRALHDTYRARVYIRSNQNVNTIVFY